MVTTELSLEFFPVFRTILSLKNYNIVNQINNYQKRVVLGHLVAENRRMRKLSWLQDYLPNALKRMLYKYV